MIIGLGHKKGSGKDTVADYLVKNYGFVKMSFADPLKEAARVICSFNDEQLYGDKKEVIDAFWGWTPREFLQRLGTEVGRSIRTDLWIKALERRLSHKDDVVIPDVRFRNEAKAIQQWSSKRGGWVVKVNRPGVICASCKGERGLFNGVTWVDCPVCQHDSEIALDGFEFDVVLNNSGTLEDLYDRVDDLMRRRL